ncbi:MAG: stage II sporulation protein M [Cyclobacteriaceae bacterium]|nr:stage II sporulation protein M [Cyclobacteriaceae bacterium]
MKETNFIKNNRPVWRKFEKHIDGEATAGPDELAAMYIQLTDDLSYARTYFPDSEWIPYLNNLLSTMHLKIYRNRKESRRRVLNFWTTELPIAVYSARKMVLLSFAIFLTGTLIGIVSASRDESFARLILSDAYVDMTLRNIEKGDPMAVYKQAGRGQMFLGISINNIKVSFLAFSTGIFTSIGPAYVLFSNAVMLGVFQYFFYDYNLLKESLLTVWIHGTFEIAAIIYAGAAGLVLGKGLLYPGTYTRLESLRFSASHGLKLIIGLIPVFIVAAFLEGFITRLTELPDIVRLGIICLSFLCIITYFIYYPRKIYRKYHVTTKNTIL